MKVSICITVFNEEKSVGRLLGSLLVQTKKPDEIIIVDGGSTDKTLKIIRDFQKTNKSIKLHIQKCKRAKGRNVGVGLAKNNIIAITDADCIADRDWLSEITKPFINKKVEVVAGFYKMICKNPMQKAFSVFLGVYPSNFDESFLPSTRSIAFRKEIWDRAGGFPESDENSAEDTEFNIDLLKLGARYVRAREALVEWKMPKSLKNFLGKIYDYAKWDAKKGEWIHPQRGKISHNTKALSIFLRYLVGALLLVCSMFNFMRLPRPSTSSGLAMTNLIHGGNLPILILLLVLFPLYIFWAFRKTYTLTNDFRAGLWGIAVQFASDFAVMAGFAMGTFIQHTK